MNKKILGKLRNVIDPELGVDIVSLGLVYDIKINKKIITVIMTLTTPGCPFGPIFEAMIKNELGENTKVEITFDPPWDPSHVSEETRRALGF
ncbi:MAG: metal-sulfur cluster assembly factor [Patescibacteria group bacterium]